MGRLAALLGQVLIAWVEDAAAPVSDDGLLDGEHGERCVADRRFPDGPLKGVAGMVRTVDTDDDSCHLALLLMLTCFFTFDAMLAARWTSGANVPASTGPRSLRPDRGPRQHRADVPCAGRGRSPAVSGPCALLRRGGGGHPTCHGYRQPGARKPVAG